MTLKGPTVDRVRAEYEYAVPPADAREMLELFCLKPVIEKTRYEVLFSGKTWEIDVFHGANQGLVIAEIELESVDESIELPGWLGDEVTGCPEYSNFTLASHPWKDRASC